MHYTLGLDYGTNSVRALIVSCSDGREVGTAVFDYPSGSEGVLLDPRDANVARQHPGDYLAGLESAVSEALRDASNNVKTFQASQVIGIGVDATGSSPIPVDETNGALALTDKFDGNLAAMCWLWKDHTAHKEAARITELSREVRPQYVAKCGNTYSSEWWWSKIWHCLKTEPSVFEAASSWVELTDWIPSVLAGVRDPRQVQRGVCCAGHKALYADEWGGLPDAEFLAMLDPKLAELRGRLYDRAWDASHKAGALCAEWAEKLGLSAGIPIGIGQMDVHYGAIGAGVRDGVLVKVIGTSTCDCSVVSSDSIADIPGICGIVQGAILPGHYSIEAGQSAVGDLFKWWVEGIGEGGSDDHARLTAEVERALPGEHGLLALDWNNGNRTLLVDQRLTGLLVGQTLQTTRAEIYAALIEATAFGARMILERLAEYGVPVQRIVCCGGIAEKSPFLMQMYADVTGREMLIAGSSQTCALGAAVAAAVLAGSDAGGHADFPTAQQSMTSVQETSYQPNQNHRAVYDELFVHYQALHDAFGGIRTAELGGVMKDLLRIKESQRARSQSASAQSS
ncbi:MAG: ribulokinase [Planctomycetota bacterium]|jgi:L-ribulokinase|nr:ribulokinase [Planctomycetota bacterium]